jgi:hypothetical protein
MLFVLVSTILVLLGEAALTVRRDAPNARSRLRLLRV